MDYIITFKNTNLAIKAEQCLLARKLSVTVQPLPSQISVGCGICLRISPDEIVLALKVLVEKNIEEIELFSKSTENNKFVYSEITDRSMLMEQNLCSILENCTNGGCGAK